MKKLKADKTVIGHGTVESPTKEEQKDHVLYYESGMTVTEIADAMQISVTDLVKKFI